MPDTCWQGKPHARTDRLSYGDGKRRVMCEVCHRVLEGPPAPPPDIAALDAGDEI